MKNSIKILVVLFQLLSLSRVFAQEQQPWKPQRSEKELLIKEGSKNQEGEQQQHQHEPQPKDKKIPDEELQSNEEQHHPEMSKEQPREIQPQEIRFDKGITLQQLEQSALKNNPTLAQAEAALKGARGRLRQARLWPNPIVGYLAEEVAFRAPGDTSEHMFFAEQDILLGGKLSKRKDVFRVELKQAEILTETQKTILLNAVRAMYFQVLGAQYQVIVRERLAKLAQEAVQTTSELFNVGAADQPDLLEAEIEAQAAQLALTEAENERQHLWKGLVAIVGNADLPLQNVAGTLNLGVLPQLNSDQLLTELLTKSPQVQTAELQLRRAETNVIFARAVRIPDLRLRGGVGYNFEQFKDGPDPVGWESFFEIGITLPIFNRNQGNIAVAQASVERARQELTRVRLALSAEFADLFAQFANQSIKAEKYQKELLPRARKAYQLYFTKFQQMAAAYPQVLIAQRNQYQLEVQYINSLTRASFLASQLRGFLLNNDALEAPAFNISTEESMVSGTSVSPDREPEMLNVSGQED